MLNFFPLLFLCVQAILALPREKTCFLKVETGSCPNTKLQRWYYSQDSRKCEPFLYNGCGGNANSFETEEECLGTCSETCYEPMFKGNCGTSEPRYYFNFMSEKCEKFMYSGCGANSNNFLSLDHCLKVCRNECTLPPETGLCKEMLSRYYYNKETKSCEIFNYGGCGGNANNFEVKKDCEASCVKTYP